MFKLNRKIALIITLLFLVVSYFIFGKEDPEVKVFTDVEAVELEEGTLLSLEEEVIEEPEIFEVKKIVVEIKGFVVSPGVYELEANSRVIDLINKAGGILDNGDVSHLNLSKSLSDEMVVVVYEKDKLPELIEPLSSDVEFKDIENTIYDKVVFEEENEDSGINTDEEVSDDSSKVSLNNGTLSDLQTLPGIGEKKAQAIIDYRTSSGPFASISEIVNVSGIGDATYEKIKTFLVL